MFCSLLERVSFKNVSKSDGIEACCLEYCVRLFVCSARGDGQGQASKHSNVIMMCAVIIILLDVTILFLQTVPP